MGGSGSSDATPTQRQPPAKATTRLVAPARSLSYSIGALEGTIILRLALFSRTTWSSFAPSFLWPRDLGARRDPLPVGLKSQAELVVVDPQVSVPAAHDCLRHDFLHFLRQYADIDLVRAVVGKPIKPEAVVETTEKTMSCLSATSDRRPPRPPASAPPPKPRPPKLLPPMRGRRGQQKP